MIGSIARCSLSLLVCLAACDGGIPQPDPDAKGEADAKVDDAALAKRKAEREAKQKEAEEAAEHLRAELERLCVVPDPMPEQVPSCEDVAQAHDDFVRRTGDADSITKWDGGEKDETTAMTIVRCTQSGSAKVALCQKNALDGAGPELFAHATDLLQTCIDRFGKAGGDPGVVPPKPAG